MSSNVGHSLPIYIQQIHHYSGDFNSSSCILGVLIWCVSDQWQVGGFLWVLQFVSDQWQAGYFSGYCDQRQVGSFLQIRHFVSDQRQVGSFLQVRHFVSDQWQVDGFLQVQHFVSDQRQVGGFLLVCHFYQVLVAVGSWYFSFLSSLMITFPLNSFLDCSTYLL